MIIVTELSRMVNTIMNTDSGTTNSYVHMAVVVQVCCLLDNSKMYYRGTLETL
jgi:hypothetical protein